MNRNSPTRWQLLLGGLVCLASLLIPWGSTKQHGGGLQEQVFSLGVPFSPWLVMTVTTASDVYGRPEDVVGNNLRIHWTSASSGLGLIGLVLIGLAAADGLQDLRLPPPGPSKV